MLHWSCFKFSRYPTFWSIRLKIRRESYWTFLKHNWPCFFWYRRTSWNVLAEGSIITVSACENVEFLRVQLYVPWALFIFALYDFAGAPQALLQSCVTFGAFSFILEGLNKQQPALAHPFSLKEKSEHYGACPPLVLPLQLQLPLPDEVKGAFSAFCKSLKNRNRSAFPTAP